MKTSTLTSALPVIVAGGVLAGIIIYSNKDALFNTVGKLTEAGSPPESAGELPYDYGYGQQYYNPYVQGYNEGVQKPYEEKSSIATPQGNVAPTTAQEVIATQNRSIDLPTSVGGGQTSIASDIMGFVAGYGAIRGVEYVGGKVYDYIKGGTIKQGVANEKYGDKFSSRDVGRTSELKTRDITAGAREGRKTELRLREAVPESTSMPAKYEGTTVKTGARKIGETAGKIGTVLTAVQIAGETLEHEKTAWDYTAGRAMTTAYEQSLKSGLSEKQARAVGVISGIGSFPAYATTAVGLGTYEFGKSALSFAYGLVSKEGATRKSLKEMYEEKGLFGTAWEMTGVPELGRQIYSTPTKISGSTSTATASYIQPTPYTIISPSGVKTSVVSGISSPSKTFPGTVSYVTTPATYHQTSTQTSVSTTKTSAGGLSGISRITSVKKK